ncbi:hypothetical protein D030_5280B, partial [Vibrio parahaemolyticus AQ3810]
ELVEKEAKYYSLISLASQNIKT